MKMRLALLIPVFAVATLAFGQAPPGKEFKGHTGLVFSVAFSPDGKTLATGSFDNTIKLWDFASGKELQTLKGHTSSVYGVAFSPDGTILASGSQDKTIRLWNPKDGKLLKELKGHGDIVNAVVFSSDGKTLASAGSDKTVRLWNPADGKEIKNLGAHKESVYTLAFSPDNLLLASGSKDTTVKLWDLKALKEVRTMPPPEVPAKPEPKKEMKKEAKDKKDKKADKKEEKKETKKIEPVEVKEFRDAVTGVAFTTDGKQIISVGCDNMVRVWNVADGKEVKKIGPTPDWIFGLAVSRDKKSIATAGYGGHLYLWDLEAGKPTFSEHLKKMITYCVTFTPDGKSLVTGHEKDNAALVTPLPASALVSSLPATAKPSPPPVVNPVPKPAPAKTETSKPDLRWTKKLANGVTVELVGITRHPAQPGSWWKPDGTALGSPPYGKLNGSVTPSAQAWEFALRLHDVPAGGIDTSYDFTPPAGASTNSRFTKSASQPFDLVGIAATFPKAGRTCTVRFGVATGPWTKEFAGHARETMGNGKLSVIFGTPREVKQHTVISVSHTPAQGALRLVVIDTDGKTQEPVVVTSSATGALAQIDAEFAVPPGRVREFQLQSRGIQVADFPDVELSPRVASATAPK